jgi:argonaute-like protein implicated in RNA metabolism and viral defense
VDPRDYRCEVEGTRKRICTFADGHFQHEEIIDYSSEKRSYGYTIECIQAMKNNRGTFAVKQDGQGSEIVWESEVDVLDPLSK